LERAERGRRSVRRMAGRRRGGRCLGGDMMDGLDNGLIDGRWWLTVCDGLVWPRFLGKVVDFEYRTRQII